MSESMKTPKTLNKGWWISLGVVVVVAILAVVIFVKPSTKTPAPMAEPTTSTTAHAVGGCNVPTGDTSSTPAMPKDLRWEAAKGTTWPISDTYGPTQAKDGYGICFARSPLGAALAMATFYGQGTTQDAKKALKLYAVDSVGKTVALSQTATTSDGIAGVGPIAFAGFSTDSFTPDEAQITMVFAVAGSSTGYVGLPSTMVWVDGDWKLKLLDDGQTFAGVASKPVAGQFTPWGTNNGL
jgi:hypothetical protein